MAKNSIRDFDATSGNNTDIQSVDISEGCAASGINNAIRELMTDLKNVSTGAVNLETPAADQLDVDNIRIDGNTISSTDTNGDITLDPNGTGAVVANSKIQFGSDAQTFVKGAGASDVDLLVSGDTNIRFETSTNEQMRIDAGGSMLLGSTTPTDLHNTWRHIIVGDKGAIISQDGAGGVPGMTIADNAYVDADTGSFAYQTTDQASKLTQEAGVLTFSNAASGTAGAALSLTERMRIAASGDLLLGTTTTIGPAQFNVDSGSQAAIGIRAGNGTSGYFNQVLFANNGNTALIGSIQRVNNASIQYNTTSDARLKENIVDMTGAIARVKQLAPKRYSWVEEDLDAADQDGFLAHEAQAVVPGAASGTQDAVDDDGNPVYMQMDYSKLVPLLTGALKEAIAKIETLETKVAALEAAE